jgi:L-iditol 2-dehydrogenase
MLEAFLPCPSRVVLREVPRPKPGKGEALVAVKRIGVCGSDIHVWHGKHPYTSYPVIQGHELSGVVEEVGEGAEVKVGKKVTVQPQVFCGTCAPCRRGDYHICENLKVMGFQTEGGAREYWKVQASKLIPLPEEVSLDEGAMVEPLSVAVHAVGKAGDVRGRRAVVLGAGPIGNFVAQVLRVRGAQVLISDPNPYRLELAEKVGIPGVNPREKELGAAVLDRWGEPADLWFECVGVEETISQAIDLSAKGGTVVVVGVFPERVRVNMGFVQDHELTLRGALMYKREDMLEAVELFRSRKVQGEPLITQRFRFTDYEKAYRFIDENKERVMKVMIEV